jgi:hypothetical protein
MSRAPAVDLRAGGIWNPNVPGGDIGDIDVTLRYYLEGDGKKVVKHHVPAQTRVTVKVADDFPGQYSVSTVASGTGPFVIERPMYFNFGGSVTGGHDVVGYPIILYAH